MGKTDYVLEPILRSLKDGEETPSWEIRSRVADSLGLSAADREYIAPGSPYAEFKYAVAHGLVRLQSHGHLKKVSTEKIYKLTPSGRALAVSPRPLTLSDITNGGSPQRSGDDAPLSSRRPERAAGRARVGTSRVARRAEADARQLPGSDRPFGPFAWLAGTVLAGVILVAAWSYIELLVTLAAITLFGGWRHLRIRREE